MEQALPPTRSSGGVAPKVLTTPSSPNCKNKTQTVQSYIPFSAPTDPAGQAISTAHEPTSDNGRRSKGITKKQKVEYSISIPKVLNSNTQSTTFLHNTSNANY